METVGRLVTVLLLPLTVFFGGAQLMTAISGRDPARVGQSGKPLNQRFGYGVNDVVQQWEPLSRDRDALAAEIRFLELDLIFPFAYGGALAAGLLIGWVALGRPCSPAWPMIVVAIALLADWTENLVQLAQLQRFSREGAGALQAGWVRVASTATVFKLSSLIVASVGLLVLALMVGGRSVRPD